ncbi:MAG: amino acid ABC transporter permease [Deltaproteobacteria bacterium]|nr:amino acid ABC transporter permease [Deltaproteobacteria bacterium]MBW2052762.1 amino acid ABC transporter permease [Deltaproteobacteria bacterium]MBW2141304.1 amino acid ABC transporter permease [Deltaproteobacteria bacterium]MBW2323239.1 amino acid ABC transporter permease [Deltaproteobacteria bacterium]
MKQRKTQIKPLDIIVLLLLIGAGVYVFYRIKIGLNYKWHWSAMPQYLFRYDEESGKWVANFLILGLFTTLRLSIWGTILATFFGTVMGLCRVSPSLFLRLVSRGYVEFIRNSPPLVLIFLFYFFIGDQIIPALGVDAFIRARSESTQAILSFLFAPPELFSSFFSALLTVSLFEGAYITEIVRAGIQSIEKGQWEASRALGLSRWQQMRYVILPQAVQRILPPLAGQFISLIKDSSIVSVISIQELTFQATELMAATYYTIEIWTMVAGLYLILTLSCSLLAERLEIRMARSR